MLHLTTTPWNSCANQIQIFPSQKDFDAGLTIYVSRTGGLFNFEYIVKNSASSKLAIESLILEHPDVTLNRPSITTPSSWGASVTTWGGMYWFAQPLDPDSEEEESTIPPKSSIQPGQTLSGFKLNGRPGPPRIVEVFMKGWVPMPILDEENDEFIVGDQIIPNADSFADSMWAGALPNQDERENSVKFITLGPSKPVTAITDLCDTFILALIGQVREAVAVGWIKHDLREDRDGDLSAEARSAKEDDDHGKRKGDKKGKKKGHDKDDDEGDDHGDADDEMDAADKNLPGVAKSIIKKLTKVRRECMRGKFGDAREKLRALIKQVNAQRGKHLTEEAYALIKFNAEFLLEKL